MDTETATSGFTRSMVMKTGLAPRDVLAGAAGSAFAVSNADAALFIEPTLAGTGIKLGAPASRKLPSAGTKTTLDVPFKIKDRKALPKGLQASVRWDPIDVAFAPPAPADEVVAAAPAEAAPAEAAPAEAAPATEAAPAEIAAEAAPAESRSRARGSDRDRGRIRG